VNTALKAGAVLVGVLATAPPAAAAASSLFGTVEFRAESLAALPQWQRTLRRIADEERIYQACARDAAACPFRAVLAWQSMLQAQLGRPAIDQLQAVNRFLNEWVYKSDELNYGRRDYWATPLEFLRHSGDCEDYAIIKYVSLRQLGYPADQLRLVVVRDTLRDLAHAVLAVYLPDDVYVLDNLTSAVLPQRRVTHYVPYYSINETTRWAHVMPLDTLASSAPDRQGRSPGTGDGRAPGEPGF
jgi:predicted transglutaminase-like cysteine proteinase